MKRDSENESVVVMGEEVSSTCRHHDRGGSVVWGVMLIFAGCLFFLNTFGVVPWEAWNDVWKFWPVLLILGGLHVVLGRSLVSRIIMTILSLIIVGLVFLVMVNRFAPGLLRGLPSNIMYLVYQMERMKP